MVIEKIISDVNTLFPKKCPCCKREFKDFADFLKSTTIPPHAVNNNFMLLHNDRGHEIIALRNCSCNTTLAIPCAMNEEFKKQLFHYIEDQANKLSISKEDVTCLMRDKIIKIALALEGKEVVS